MTDHIEPLTPPKPGDGEAAWTAYAKALATQLEHAEVARAASRKAANRRSWLLNAIHRDLKAGDVAAARQKLERRDHARQEACR
jgi:hypothetical protein